MQETLFNPPVWMPAAAVVIAIGVFVYGNARVQTPVRNAGLGLLGLAVAWCVAALIVQTRVEKCITRTHAIVAAVEQADWTKLGSLLDKGTTLEFLRGGEAVVNATQTTAGAYGLKDIRVFGTEAVAGPSTVDVTFSSLLEGQRPLTASFRFEYEDRSDGMLLAKIVPLKIGDMNMDQVRNAIR